MPGEPLRPPWAFLAFPGLSLGSREGPGEKGGAPRDPGITLPSPLATLAFLLALPHQLKLVERKWLSRNRVQRSTALGVSPIFFPNLIVGLRVVFGSPCLAGPRIPVFDLCTSVAASQTVQSIIQSMPSLGSSSATAGSVQGQARGRARRSREASKGYGDTPNHPGVSGPSGPSPRPRLELLRTRSTKSLL